MLPVAPVGPAAVARPQPRRAGRLLAAIRVALVIALTAHVLAGAVLAHVVNFPGRPRVCGRDRVSPELVWSVPLLMGFFTASSQVGTTSTKVSTRLFWWVVSVTGDWAKAGAPDQRQAGGHRQPAGDEPQNPLLMRDRFAPCRSVMIAGSNHLSARAVLSSGTKRELPISTAPQ
jgi:hypothetical protein